MRSHTELLSSRVREIRIEKFGAEGVQNLAQAMNIAAPTWENFESGVLIPAWILLKFVVITGVEPHWLLSGKGDRYRIPLIQSSRRASP